MLVFGNQDWITTLYYAFQDEKNLVSLKRQLYCLKMSKLIPIE